MTFKADLWEAFVGRGLVVPWWIRPAAARLDDRRRSTQVRRMFLPSLWQIGGKRRTRYRFHHPLAFMLSRRRRR